MRFRRRSSRAPERIQLEMTPMIDIVFQLLAFFIMTFKVVTVEGDFYVQMPPAGPASGDPVDPLTAPLRVRLEADAEGDLAGIFLEGQGQSFANTDELTQAILALTTGDGELLDSLEVEFDCDYNLKYKYSMGAISAVSGYRTEDGQTVKLIDKIKLAPPRPE